MPTRRPLPRWLTLLIPLALLAAAALTLHACGELIGGTCDQYCFKLSWCGVEPGDDCIDTCNTLVAIEGDTYYQCVIDSACEEISNCSVTP